MRCPGPADPKATWLVKQGGGPLHLAIPSHWEERYAPGRKNAFWSLGQSQPPEAGVFVGLDQSEPDFIGDLIEVKKDLVNISGHLADSYTGWSPERQARANFVVFRQRHEGLVLTAGFVSTAWQEYRDILDAIRTSMSIKNDPIMPQIAAALGGPNIGPLKAPPPKPIETTAETETKPGSQTSLAPSNQEQPAPAPAAKQQPPASPKAAQEEVLTFPDETVSEPAPASQPDAASAAEPDSGPGARARGKGPGQDPGGRRPACSPKRRSQSSPDRNRGGGKTPGRRHCQPNRS